MARLERAPATPGPEVGCPSFESHPLRLPPAPEMPAAPSRLVVALAALVALDGRPADAHSSLITPPPRNAVDRSLPQWHGGHFGYANCSHPARERPNPLWGNGSCWGCNCVNGTDKCEVAQTCLWFADGTSIGCERPDGGPSNPNKKDRCGSEKKPTNNDPYFRTVNRDAVAMSPEDWAQHNPWR